MKVSRSTLNHLLSSADGRLDHLIDLVVDLPDEALPLLYVFVDCLDSVLKHASCLCAQINIDSKF